LIYCFSHLPPIDIGFYSALSEKWSLTSYNEPTHWMPLPSPPENENILKLPRSFQAMGEKG